MNIFGKLEKWLVDRRHLKMLKEYGDIHTCPWCKQIAQNGQGWYFDTYENDVSMDVLTCGVCHGRSLWQFSIGMIFVKALDHPLMNTFQDEAGEWATQCFGETIAYDKQERADRFLEEALELVQTVDTFTVDRAHALVDYVFNRPVGEAYQEIGGVMVTLATLCNAIDQNIINCSNKELDRIWGKIEAIRAKQASKPTGSALPQ